MVARRPRASLKAFAKMLLTYGRGRAEQFRLHPTFGSALNFVPPLFVAYLLVAVITVAAAPALGRLLLPPLGLYCLAVVAQVLMLAAKGRWWSSLGAMPLIVLTHVLYGLGFWRGLFTSLKPAAARAPVAVELEVIQK